jgi:hypothetical protein
LQKLVYHSLSWNIRCLVIQFLRNAYLNILFQWLEYTLATTCRANNTICINNIKLNHFTHCKYKS